jgi:hypothetical protein
LLDLEHGQFYALNATGTRLLTLALEFGSAEAVCRVAREQRAEEQRVRADWAQLLGKLRRRRLLTIAETADRRALPGRPALWLLLTLAWLSLRLFGWAGTLRLWGRGCRPTARPCPTSLAPLVRQLDESIRGEAATHPLNPQCKERALVAWHILRNRWGLPAELVVGVLFFPFQAHAWVECGSWMVTDERSRCDAFTPAVRYS